MRKLVLQDSFANTSKYEKSVIILGGRQFTTGDTGFDEEDINITDGYLWFVQFDNPKKISLQDFRRFIGIQIWEFKSQQSRDKKISTKFNFKKVVEYLGISLQSIPQFSYVIDGGDKCHFTKWSPLEENGMIPILVPNIGFKQFSEIRPDLETWMKDIDADTYTIEPIHKTKNTIESVDLNHFYKETYTGTNFFRNILSQIFDR